MKLNACLRPLTPSSEEMGWVYSTAPPTCKGHLLSNHQQTCAQVYYYARPVDYLAQSGQLFQLNSYAWPLEVVHLQARPLRIRYQLHSQCDSH